MAGNTVSWHESQDRAGLVNYDDDGFCLAFESKSKMSAIKNNQRRGNRN